MIAVWRTTPDRTSLLERQTDLAWSADDPSLPAIALDAAERRQPILGVGAALTDSSAWLLSRAMEPAARRQTLRALFDPKRGNGFAALRWCIGASDFTVGGSYTACDTPDPSLEAFTIERERQHLIPLLRDIRRLQPRLTTIASPWSAPAWMKTNRHLNGGALAPEHEATFARYLVTYVQAMADARVRIDYLTCQNEPRHESKTYPSMRMEPDQQARLIREHLGPALADAGLPTRILCWDHNWDAPEYPLAVLADPGARRYTAGSAFHGYAGEVAAQEKIRVAYPDKEIHFTESSGGDWATDFGGNLRWDLTNLLLGSVRYGARTVLKWNLVLDERHGPQNGGCTDCRGVVTWDRTTGNVAYNEEFYAFGHVSRVVPPGSWHLATLPVDGLSHAAFRRRDGRHALVCCADTERRFTLRHKGRSATVVIPAGGALSLLWK